MTTYCSLADVKAYGGLASTLDVAVNALLAPVTAGIDSFCDSSFTLKSNVTEYLNGNSNYKIQPKNVPIISVSALSVDTVAVAAASNEIATGYVFDESTIYLRSGALFTRGVRNIKLTYTAGYSVVPDDVRQAAVEWILFKLAKRDRPDKKSEIIGQQTVHFDMNDMPAGVASALKQYRRWAI